jgi:hypothetical protein
MRRLGASSGIAVIGVVAVVFISDTCDFLDRKGYTLERVCAVWNLDETKSVAALRDWNVSKGARAAVLYIHMRVVASAKSWFAIKFDRHMRRRFSVGNWTTVSSQVCRANAFLQCLIN